MSDAQPDPRPPRPQYGEYATPEEQRARIQRPDATEALESGQAAEPATAAPAAASAASAAAPEAGARRGPLADRVATILLLAYGLLNVVTAVPEMLAYERLAARSLEMAGVDATFTNFTTGRVWGAVGAILFVLGLMVTAYFAWRRMRRGRIAFWIPLVGALVTGLAVGVCLAVPLLTDPSLLQALGELGRPR